MTGSALLAIVALVAAVNPCRVAEVGGRLPPPGEASGGRSQVATAAAGAALAALMLVLLGAGADGLLDAADVSAPTVLVGAGLVLIGAGAKDLFIGPPAAEPAMTGWGAAIVPVAIPATARPQVGLLALSTGATHGMGAVVLGSLLMVLCVAGLVALGSTGVRARVRHWLGALAAVVTVGAGVAFAVEGVFSV